MAAIIDKLNTSGTSVEENIRYLQLWANKLTQQMNYTMQHLDRSNFDSNSMPMFKDDVDAKVSEASMELRAYVVSRLAPTEGE